MKIILTLLTVTLLFIIPLSAQESAAEAPAIESFKAGGVSINIPPPAEGFVEVGYDNREFMEIMVPASNRLLCAFVTTEDLPRLTAGDEGLMMERYAMVQVARRAEYLDCDKSAFKEVTDGAKETFGDIISSTFKDAEDEFNNRMKDMELDEIQISIEEPTQLGCFFFKENAYAFGMISAVSTNDVTIKMTGCSVLLRVKDRLIFAYLYAEYKSEETILWLREATEKWSDEILAANM